MGFKKINFFNQALLAKQAWRLLQLPTSLVGRVLKAKYYPTCNFLTATSGRFPSYLWRSFLHGRDLLLRGIRWRIGDGTKIRVFSDPWIPAPSSFRVITPFNFLSDQLQVSDLLDHGKWRMDLLEVLFCPRDRELISHIPVCPTGGEDLMIWHYTSHGRFTVSSAYRLAVQNYLCSRASSSGTDSDWSLLWKCEAPPKILIFAWQLCNKALPIGCNLFKRRILTHTACPRCLRPVEDDLHLFLLCPFARSVWMETEFSVTALLAKASSWLNVFHLLDDEADRRKLKLSRFLMYLWGIWIARHKWVFSSRTTTPTTIVNSSMALLTSFYQNRVVVPRGVPSPEVKSTTWIPPPIGWFMLNTDAAYLSTGASYGYVLRNHHGRVIQSGAGPLRHVHTAEHAEAMAIWKSFIEVQEFWETPIVIATDCLKLVMQVTQKDRN